MISAIFTSSPHTYEIALTIAPVFLRAAREETRLPFLGYTAEVQRLSLHARDWEEMAKLDPLWAILSEPEKRFGNWDPTDFFRTGEVEIAGLMKTAQQMGLPRQHKHAIDFGCGIGRLTRALKSHFQVCHGVDISSRMLEMARRLTTDCDFRQANDLSSFKDGSADLIYSNLVLQHQPDRAHVVHLIGDMLRVLAPGGLLVFQMPVHLPLRNRIQPRRRAYRVLRALGVGESIAYQKLKLSPIRMLWLPRGNVESIVRAAGGETIRVDEQRARNEPFTSGIFYCTRHT
jgi:ubiquinone/menaquinone biosynthesis C-methylase UbiE